MGLTSRSSKHCLTSAGENLAKIFQKLHTLTLLLSCTRGQRILTSLLAEYAINIVNLNAVLEAAHIFNTHDDPQACAEHGDNLQRNILCGALGLALLNTKEVFKSVHWMTLEQEAGLCGSGCCSGCNGGAVSRYFERVTSACYHPEMLTALSESCASKLLVGMSVALGTVSRMSATSAATFNSVSLIEGIQDYEACPIPQWYFSAMSVALGVLIAPYKVAYLANINMRPCLTTVLTSCYALFKNIPIFAGKFGELFLAITQAQANDASIEADVTKASLYSVVILLALAIFTRSQVSLAIGSSTDRATYEDLGVPTMSGWRRATNFVSAHMVGGTFGWLAGDAVGTICARETSYYSPANPSVMDDSIYWPVCFFTAYVIYMVTYFRVYQGMKIRQ